MSETKKLTLKQGNFIREVANGKTQYESYLIAYPTSKKWKRNSVDNKASLLMSNAKIMQRLEELKKPIQEKFEYTIEQSFKNLLKVQEKIMSEESKNYQAFIKAEELKGKLLGLYTEKIETKLNGSLSINDLSKLDNKTLLQMAKNAEAIIEEE